MIDYGQYDQLPPVHAEIERMYQRENDRLVNSRYECYEPEARKSPLELRIEVFTERRELYLALAAGIDTVIKELQEAASENKS